LTAPRHSATIAQPSTAVAFFRTFLLVNDFAPLVVGLSLIALAAFLIRWHFGAWKGHQADSTIDDRELRYYRFQFRRRLFVSALLILLGVLIPSGDGMLVMLQRRPPAPGALLPALIAGYWILVLIIAMLLMVLALIDLAAGNAHRRAMRGAIQGLARKRRELEAEVARLQADRRNGETPG